MPEKKLDFGLNFPSTWRHLAPPASILSHFFWPVTSKFGIRIRGICPPVNRLDPPAVAALDKPRAFVLLENFLHPSKASVMPIFVGFHLGRDRSIIFIANIVLVVIIASTKCLCNQLHLGETPAAAGLWPLFLLPPHT